MESPDSSTPLHGITSGVAYLFPTHFNFQNKIIIEKFPQSISRSASLFGYPPSPGTSLHHHGFSPLEVIYSLFKMQPVPLLSREAALHPSAIIPLHLSAAVLHLSAIRCLQLASRGPLTLSGCGPPHAHGPHRALAPLGGDVGILLDLPHVLRLGDVVGFGCCLMMVWPPLHPWTWRYRQSMGRRRRC